MPYLSALEVCSRRGAKQIHVYLYLYHQLDMSTLKRGPGQHIALTEMVMINQHSSATLFLAQKFQTVVLAVILSCCITF